ncbi:hypothetical protein C8Q70DRAFT_11959 [Cubamyces menziesii]|uniref:Uncharacterized protein n=1 Tax=Trametes cubensis TaxID=1111947 RepID=A0AAD7XF04_9APHY|nr:hypothetical protein C8Q70DRAFT_11959 [Cubamyces menziesii]KAJ8496182.1 hypothetical protein ONZ51_g1304 [Trametes cubensis]
MDKLAVELLDHIFSYACTDGGQTGCALALVSKRIRATSRPARFYSVALFSSPTKIEKFLHAYERECARAADARPRVRHLWLSYHENEQGPSAVPTMPAKPPTSRAEFLAILQRRTQHWRSAQENLDEQYNRVIPMLIKTVAADLYSLALCQARWRSSSVVNCAFPRLQEITLIGGDPSFLPFSSTEDGAILYPSLRRLHHILTPVCKDVNFLNWTTHAPALTHLRVSRLDYCPHTTLETFEQAIGRVPSSHRFEHLEYVMVLPHPPPASDLQSGFAAIAYAQFLQHLREMPEHVKVPMTVLQPLIKRRPHQGTDAPPECIVHLRELWMERIEGGPGCWVDDVVAEPAPTET